MIDFERYTKTMLIVLAVYFILFLFVFLPFVPKAAEFGLLGEPFLWLIILLNLLPIPLFALYFFGRIEGRIAKFALMLSGFFAAFFTVLFLLPLQL